MFVPPGRLRWQPRPATRGRLDIDYGRCVVCQLCTEACPRRHDAFLRLGLWCAVAGGSGPERRLGVHIVSRKRRGFRRSLHIRHVDAGSCNGCESELQALNNPFYNLHRLGIFFTASPRFADLLLVTGPVTYAMRKPLQAAYEAMPEPRWVMAIGTCAVSGGVAEGGYACGHGLEEVLPVMFTCPAVRRIPRPSFTRSNVPQSYAAAREGRAAWPMRSLP